MVINFPSRPFAKINPETSKQIKRSLLMLRLAGKLLDEYKNVKNKAQKQAILKAVAPVVLKGSEKDFIKLVNKSTLLKRAKKLRKQIKKLGINIRFVNGHVILKYPLKLTVKEAIHGVSYAAHFRDIMDSIEGMRKALYRKRLSEDIKRSDRIKKAVKADYKRILAEGKYKWGEYDQAVDELMEQYGKARYTIKKMIYSK